MLIAQFSVAGEEHTRPETPSTCIAGEDQQALEEFACDRSNLPWVIFRAAHRANHVIALPPRARSLLAALARTVDAARPFAAIFARRELLTGRAMQSMRTFYRSLEDLERTGMITRPPQTRYGAAGLFGRAYLYLTPKAATLLGLAQDDEQAAAQSENRRESDALAETPILFVEPSVTVADRAIYKDLNPITQKRQPETLPRDLQRLRILGFRDFLIFKLMGEARRNMKRLSDVVEATWEHLQRAKQPISYLRALLRSPVDFAYRVRSAHQEEVVAHAEKVQRAEADSFAQDLAGREFRSLDGSKSFYVADDASSVVVRDRDNGVTRVRTGRWIHDFQTALNRGAITASTPAGSIVRSVELEQSRRTVSADRLAELKAFLKRQRAVGLLPRSTSSSISSASVTPPERISTNELTNEYSDHRATVLRLLLSHRE